VAHGQLPLRALPPLLGIARRTLFQLLRREPHRALVEQLHLISQLGIVELATAFVAQ